MNTFIDMLIHHSNLKSIIYIYIYVLYVYTSCAYVQLIELTPQVGSQEISTELQPNVVVRT